MAATFIVTNIASLKQVLSLQRHNRVVITTPCIMPRDRAKLQDQMNRLLGESGFGAFAAGVVISLIICISWNGAYWDFFLAHLVRMIAFSLMACFFAGGTGRATGLLYARWKLARLIWQTRAMYEYSADSEVADLQTTTFLGV